MGNEILRELEGGDKKKVRRIGEGWKERDLKQNFYTRLSPDKRNRKLRQDQARYKSALKAETGVTSAGVPWKIYKTVANQVGGQDHW